MSHSARSEENRLVLELVNDRHPESIEEVVDVEDGNGEPEIEAADVHGGDGARGQQEERSAILTRPFSMLRSDSCLRTSRSIFGRFQSLRWLSHSNSTIWSRVANSASGMV